MISLIELFNCGPFRGRHRIELREGVYAIIAAHENEPKKSNGVGKSFILEMIDFAITGRLNPSREGTVDRWITHGEPGGSVAITFEDGACITRSKKRGQSTQVRFVGSPTAPFVGEAAQDAASAAVLKYLAMTDEDFRNAAYFEQRKMARLVDPDQTKPGARLDIVSGWFGLGLAERADERAREIAAEHERELTKMIAERTSLAPESPDLTVHDLAVLEGEVEKLEERLRGLQAERREQRVIERHEAVAAAQTKRIEDGKALREKLAAMENPAKDAEAATHALTTLANAVAAAEADVRAKKKVSLGLFDGACPVAPLKCPATKQINADRSGTAVALQEAREALHEAVTEHDAAVTKYAPLLRRERDYENMQRDLEVIREAVRTNADAARDSKTYLAHGPGRGEDIEADIDAVTAGITTAKTKLGIAKSDSAARERTMLRVKDLDSRIEQRTALVKQHLKAAAIFRTAQRRVAERNLAFVEDEANYQLTDASIDLSVKARWEREAGGPAKTCDTCGAAFPTSAKIKTCERCGEARGVHTVQRLDFILSDRSGALNDMGGVVLQLAAGSWLLGARHSPWSTALLDEPFAACDSYNRRALAVQFMKLLSRGTFRQAIVISHSPDTVDLYPRKIVITAHADGSRSIEQR